jgi:hypothetical protein
MPESAGAFSLSESERERIASRLRAANSEIIQRYPGESAAKVPAPEQVTEAFVDLAEPACTRHGELIQAQSALPRTG